jgi:DNA-binding NarL/FixJ family response regulator
VVDSGSVQGANRALYTQINEWLPALKVLFLGTQEDARDLSPDDIPSYMRLDTVGFLLKDGPTSRMTDAIRLVASGTFVCETELIRHPDAPDLWRSCRGATRTAAFEREFEC